MQNSTASQHHSQTNHTPTSTHGRRLRSRSVLSKSSRSLSSSPYPSSTEGFFSTSITGPLPKVLFTVLSNSLFISSGVLPIARGNTKYPIAAAPPCNHSYILPYISIPLQRRATSHMLWLLSEGRQHRDSGYTSEPINRTQATDTVATSSYSTIPG